MVCCLRLDRSITGGLMSVYGWGGVGGGGAYKRQFTVRELEHKICRRCNDPGGGVLPSKRLMEMCR